MGGVSNIAKLLLIMKYISITQIHLRFTLNCIFNINHQNSHLKRHHMKLFLFFFLLFDGIHAQCPIIPTPTEFQSMNEYKSIEIPFFEIGIDDLEPELLNYFSDRLAVFTGLKVKEVESFSPFLEVRFVSLTSIEIPDYYSISVTEDVIEIGFTSKESKFYALNSFLQLFQKKNGKVELLKCTLTDAPAFSWRGLHLDVSRHFFSVQEVKRFIDIMSFYKFNKFHWHLTDDQGWRIEIKKYPLLTEVGAFRDSTVNGHFNQVPRTYDVERVGGFYTQEEIKEVIRYAQERYIEIVPEIEMPGHARAALAAYPHLSCTGIQQPVEGLWGVFEDIFCSKLETMTFLQDVLSEVVALFPSEYIHIGGDEAPKFRWKECEKCQLNIQKNGLKDEYELQSYFIQQMDDFLTSKGKKMIGWDEILEGGLSTNAAVMSWRGEQGGIDAANQNHYVVMSPTTYCYFDYYQSGNSLEPLAIGGYLPLEKVYEYSPIPKELSVEKHLYILGGQANLWTEYIQTYSQLEYMTYPRALALIQGLWCQNKPDYEHFLRDFRMYHESILAQLEVNYAKSIYFPKMEVSRIQKGVIYQFKGLEDTNYFKINYSDAHSGVLIQSNSLQLHRTENGVLRNSSLRLIDDGMNELMTFEIVEHNAVGLKVDLITLPHPKYGHNGSVTLVDGIKGSRPWKGDQWLGFNANEVELVIDIPKEKQLKDITLGFLDAKGSWIYLPKEVDVFVLNKRNKWVKYSTVAISDENQLLNLDIVTEKLKLKIRPISEIPIGQEGAGNLPWIFIDEIILNYAK